MSESTLHERLKKFYKVEYLTEKLDCGRRQLYAKFEEPERFSVANVIEIAKMLQISESEVIQMIKKQRNL